MNSAFLILTAITMLSISGVPALFGSRCSLVGQRCAALMLVIGSGLGLWAVGPVMLSSQPILFDLPWFLPMGRFSIQIDVCSSLFLVPVFVVPALGAIYGLGYWKQSGHSENGIKLGLFYGLLAGSMAMVVIAHDAVLFLMAWEVMALSAYFAATVEDDDASVRRAGWVYLIATHAGTLCLIAMFALLRHVTGSFALEPFAAVGIQPSVLSLIFILAVIGFGFKAGLMPLHVWLPGAHATAPSHVSAVMSGVMLKMGVYGMVRMAAVLPVPPTWWGGMLLALGGITGVFGIAFAIGQHDLKRALAYSSIENIGIITMGLGLALLGRSLQRMDWIVLGLGGALLHVWNHSLFKSLLFLNAGSIIHATHTRQIDRMGGLAKRMPLSAFLFLFGAIAICGLPPLNGFSSEWLIYLGLLRTVGTTAVPAWPVAGLGAAVLAMIGALAVVCFVKLYGTIFLGEPRSDATVQANDPNVFLWMPMVVMAAGCLVIGLIPWIIAPMLDRAAAEWSNMIPLVDQPIHAIAPLGWISAMGLALIFGSIAAIVLLKWSVGQRIARVGTWDCGYAKPTSRIQYTGSSFGQSLVALFAWALWPKSATPQIIGICPLASHFKSNVPDTVLERLVLPVFRVAERCLLRLRLFQQGNIQIYIIYFLAAVMLLLFWGGF